MDPKRLMMARFFFICFKKRYQLCVQSCRGDQLHHHCHRRHYHPHHHHRHHPRHRHRHRHRHLHRRDCVFVWRLMATKHETIIKPCAVIKPCAARAALHAAPQAVSCTGLSGWHSQSSAVQTTSQADLGHPSGIPSCHAISDWHSKLP